MSSINFPTLIQPKFGRAKRIKIWANGKPDCYEFFFNPKNFRSWTAILIDVTNILQPTFGAVRKLLALSTMQFVDSFEDLDPNEKYIALGTNCKFKPIPEGYKTAAEREGGLKKRSFRRLYTGDINSKTETFLVETKKRKLTVLYVVVSGRISQTHQKVVFNDSDLKDWSIIKRYLTKLLDIPEGIKCITTIFGQVIQNPYELQHGFLYVAVPCSESFVMMDYTRFLQGTKHRSSYTLSIRQNSSQSVSRTYSGSTNGFSHRSLPKTEMSSDISRTMSTSSKPWSRSVDRPKSSKPSSGQSEISQEGVHSIGSSKPCSGFLETTRSSRGSTSVSESGPEVNH